MTSESTISTVEFNQNARLIFNAETGLDEWVTPKTRMYTVPGVVDAGNLPRPLSMGELVMVVCLERATAMENDILAIMAEMNYNTEALNELTSIEEQLVDGKDLRDIAGPFYYQGVKYETAVEFVAVMLDIDMNLGDLLNAYDAWDGLKKCKAALEGGELINNIYGPFRYNGVSHDWAAWFLPSLGITTWQGLIQEAQRVKEAGYITESQKAFFIKNEAWNPLNPTIDGLLQIVNSKYLSGVWPQFNSIMSYWQERVGVFSDTDELISKIEAKMDSMNSFSQQKMIELQSDTNKRDQSFDMITNILKSLNSTLMGNANNL